MKCKNQPKIFSKVSKILLTVFLFVIAQTATMQQVETACYYKSSPCDACYSLCSNQNITDLPYFVKQCLITDTQIDLELTPIDHKNDINIIFLLKYAQENSINNCQLTNIRIIQSDEFLDDKFNISIRSGYLQNNQIFQSINYNNQAMILNAQFYFQNLNYVEISTLYFTGDQIQQNPALNFEKVLNSTVKNSKFYNNTIKQNNGGAISLKQLTFMSIHNTLFEKNQLLYKYYVTEFMGGTAIYLTDSSTLQCYNCSFLNNDAICLEKGGVGGAIYLSDSSVIDICQNCNFIGNKATMGGAIYVTEYSLFSNCINCLFDSNLGYDSGGAVGIYKYSAMTQILNTYFINNKQVGIVSQRFNYGGGAVYIQKYSAFQNSSDCFFYNNSANSQGGAILIRESSIYSSSPNCFFMENKADWNGGAILIYQNSNYNNSPNCNFSNNIGGINGGAIYICAHSIYSNSSNCIFSNNQANNHNGGSIYMDQNCVYSHSANCTFKQNFARNHGGAIYVSQFSIYTYSANVIFCYNHADKNGGAVYIDNYSNYSYSSNCTFFGNSAEISGGAIQIFYNSIYFNSPNCTFYNNSAEYGGAIFIASHSKYLQSPSCKFEKNIAQKHGGAIFICQSIYDGSQNCLYQNNIAGSVGGALSFFTFSAYKNSPFCNFTNNQANSSGGAIFLQDSSYSDSSDSIFQNNMAQKGDGGALKLEQFSKYTNSPNCIFIKNIAFDSGGAISLYNHSQYVLSPNTKFIQNYASKYGGGIAIEWSSNFIFFNLQQIYFENNSAYSGGAFYSDFSANTNIQQSSFINNTAQSGNGGAVYFDQILQINYDSVQTNISNNLFIRNTAILGQGGSIFTKSNINLQNITIESSQFKQNLAIIGGAISLEYVLMPSFINNSFSFNEATQQGGAFYCKLSGFIFNFVNQKMIGQDSYNKFTLFYSSKYEIRYPFLIQNNQFNENQAKEVAGAIYLDFTQSQQSIVNNFYHQEIDITDKQKISIKIIEFCFVNNIFKNNFANYGGAAVRINGFDVSMVLDNALNGSCAQTQRMIYENNNTFENNTSPLFKQFTPQNFLQYQKISQEEILCSCLYGEKLAQNPTNQAYFCQKCEENTYLNQYHDNLTVNQSCIQCPSGFNCPGDYENLKVQQNYWRYTNLSIRGNDQIFEAYRCDLDYQIKQACVGYERCQENPTQCSDDLLFQINYMGPACQICNEKQKYYAAGQNSCQKCGSNTMIILKLVGIVIIILVLLIISISSTIRKIHKKLIIKCLRIGFDQIIVDKDQQTALMRIITNYFQNTSYFFLLQIQVPDYMGQFFLFAKNLGQPLQSFSNTFQCLLDQYQIEGIIKKLQYLLYQFIWSLALPTVVVILIYIIRFLQLILIKKKIRHPTYLLIVPTYIYLYLEFLPTLFYNSLSFLTCRRIAGRKYLIGDNQYECSQAENGVYSFQNLSIALLIFLFQLIVPIVLVIILVMFKNKNLLNKPVKISSCKYQLGYLYLGYKQSCYYWEFVRIFQRLLITSSFLVLYDYKSQKAALVILILFLYSLLANIYNPSENIMVQQAEYYSNNVQIFTFISALLLQQFTYSWLYYIFLIAVKFINIIFIIYMLNLMLINVKMKLIILLIRYEYFKRFEFVRNIIEKHKQQRIIAKKWIDLKTKIIEIIRFGCNNTNQILLEKELLLNSNNFNQEDKQIHHISIQSKLEYKLLSEEDEEQINNSRQVGAENARTELKFYQSQKEFGQASIN